MAMPAWRARAFHLTRSRTFLARGVALILTVSALAAVLVHSALSTGAADAGQTDLHAQLLESARRLQHSETGSAKMLADWIRLATAVSQTTRDAAPPFDPAALRLGTIELDPLLARHTEPGAQRDAFTAYVRIRFLKDGQARTDAWRVLEAIARHPEPPPHVQSLHGDVLLLQDKPADALWAYMAESSLPEGAHARRQALDLALRLGEPGALRTLVNEPLLRKDCEPITLWRAGKAADERSLLFHALWRLQASLWVHHAAVPLALLAAAVWYVILVHTASRERLRWWRHLPAVMAGVASVWLVHWWQGTLQYHRDPTEAPSMAHEVTGWILHVGLPEEAAKLCLFAFFLPVLLHAGSGVKAALTGGCVGLGFALDENLHYFRSEGMQVAVGRLLTANFMHLAFTGILGWHLYELFRSRFHHATGFLVSFLAVTAAHGVYDFSAGVAAAYWGFDMAGIIILAVAAKVFFALLHEDGVSGLAISRTAVFCFGSALLAGVLMNVMVAELGSLTGMTYVLKESLALALVALLFVRELHELR